jgi:ferritin-like metal-binding protein YciE
MKALSTLEDFYVTELRDLYDAENQLVKALPKMADSASSNQLQDLLLEHLQQTKSHCARLEEIFERLGLDASGKKCKAMKGLVSEGKDILKEDAEEHVLDAGIITVAQKVEHYEIASYGSVVTFAKQLGYEEDAKLLEQTLNEEKEADKKLTELAVNIVNPNAKTPSEVESVRE